MVIYVLLLGLGGIAMISSWTDYSALHDKTREEMKTCPGFISAVVTRTDGMLLVSNDGREIHRPALTCGTERMQAHFAASLLDLAKLGRFRQLREYLQYCDRLVATRNQEGQVELVITQVFSPTRSS